MSFLQSKSKKAAGRPRDVTMTWENFAHQEKEEKKKRAPLSLKQPGPERMRSRRNTSNGS